MKKILLPMVFCIVTYGFAFSQTAERKSSTFQLSLFPPLSTNGIRSYEYSNKASLNLLVGLSRNEEGISIAGLTNIILNDAKGFQLAGLSNVVKNNLNGFQFAGIINIAKHVNGIQFAGVINKAKHVNGVQLGIVNIAEENDYPIGIVNMVKNGEKGVAITYNDVGSIMATFRSGGRVTYGIIGVGYNHQTSGRSYATEAGLGIHLNCLTWFRINNEVKVACFGFSDNPFIFDDDQLSNTVIHANYSILPGFKISPHIELFGGPSLNYMNSHNTNKELDFGHSIWKKTGSTRLQQIYVGYQVGIQYIF